MHTVVRLAVGLTLVAAFFAVPASAQTSCSLSPVFALFRQVAGAEVVGECKEPATVAENGDITQATTKGLAVFRYADQTVALTDGQTTWLYGPEGLQSRPIANQFPWEVQGQRTAVAVLMAPTAGPRIASATATPTPTVAALRPSDDNAQLAVRCSQIVQREWTPLATQLGAGPNAGAGLAQAMEGSRIECLNAATFHGKVGVDCYETALQQGMELARRGGGGTGLSASIRGNYVRCVDAATLSP